VIPAVTVNKAFGDHRLGDDNPDNDKWILVVTKDLAWYEVGCNCLDFGPYFHECTNAEY
jgi:hypothetical protein